MTPKRPRPPGPALLAWLTVTGHAIAVAASLGASVVVVLMLSAIDLIGVVAILSFYFGRLHEWRRTSRYADEQKHAHRRQTPGGTLDGLSESPLHGARAAA